MTEHLDAAEAHVWVVPLDAFPADAGTLAGCLSSDEISHRDACPTDDARRRFVVSRAALRVILSHYTGRPPASLMLRRGALGKPFLEQDDGRDDALHFSLSHSRATTVVAVARSETGIDVEHEREPARLQRIARRLLHAETVALLERLHGAARRSAFLDAWTLREAHVKAVGGGLFRTPDTLPFRPAQDLDTLVTPAAPAAVAGPDDVSCPGESSLLVPHVVMERTPRAPWSVVRFTPGDGLRAVCVVRGIIAAVRLHDADALRLLFAEEQP
jgi:4'-phosphopantetheinyl transferase